MFCVIIMIIKDSHQAPIPTPLFNGLVNQARGPFLEGLGNLLGLRSVFGDKCFSTEVNLNAKLFYTSL